LVTWNFWKIALAYTAKIIMSSSLNLFGLKGFKEGKVERVKITNNLKIYTYIPYNASYHN